MNKIYKVIWSKVRNCYVAVSEIAKRNGKSCTSVNCGAKANRGHAGVALALALSLSMAGGGVAWAADITTDAQVDISGNEPETIYYLRYPDGTTEGTGAKITVLSGATIKGITGYYNGNTITINSSGKVLQNIFGGNNNYNKVTVYGTVSGYVRGGSHSNGVSENEVYINGGTVESEVYGGYSSDSTAKNNLVQITSGTVKGKIYGGYTNGAGAQNNRVIIDGGDIQNNVYGGYIQGGVGDASGNIIEINHASVKNIYGAYIIDNSPSVSPRIPVHAKNNVVKLNGATVDGSIYGGYITGGGGRHYPTNNELILLNTSNSVTGNVYNFATYTLSDTVLWDPGKTVLSADNYRFVNYYDSAPTPTYDISSSKLRDGTTYGKMTLFSSNTNNMFSSAYIKYNNGTSVTGKTLNESAPRLIVKEGTATEEPDFVNGVKLAYNEKEHTVSLDSTNNFKSIFYSIDDNVTGVSFGEMTWGTGRNAANTHYDFSKVTNDQIDITGLSFTSPQTITQNEPTTLLTNALNLAAGTDISHTQNFDYQVSNGAVLNATMSGTVLRSTANAISYQASGTELKSVDLAEWDGTKDPFTTNDTWTVVSGGIPVSGSYSTPNLAAGVTKDIIITGINNAFLDNQIDDAILYSSTALTDDIDKGVTLSGTSYSGVKAENSGKKLTYYAPTKDITDITLGTMTWDTGRTAGDLYIFNRVNSIDATGFSFSNPDAVSGFMYLLSNATGLAANAVADIPHTQADFTTNMGNGTAITATLTGTISTAEAGMVKYTATGTTISTIDLSGWDVSTSSVIPTGWSLASDFTVETDNMNETLLNNLPYGSSITILTASGTNFFDGITINGANAWNGAADIVDADESGVSIVGTSTGTGVKVDSGNKNQIIYQKTKEAITNLRLAGITFEAGKTVPVRSFGNTYDLTVAPIVADDNMFTTESQSLMEAGDTMTIVDATAAIKNANNETLAQFNGGADKEYNIAFSDTITGKNLTLAGTHTDTLSQVDDTVTNTKQSKLIYTVGDKNVSRATLTGAIAWSDGGTYYKNGTVANQKNRNSVFTFNDSSEIDISGVKFSATDDPLAGATKTMTLIGGNTINSVDKNVAGTITNGTPASFDVSLTKNNTLLAASASGTAAIDSGDLKFTVTDVTLDTITVKSVGDTPDTVPTGWELKKSGSAIAATVETGTGSTAMTPPSGLTPGETKVILTAGESLEGITINGDFKWQENGSSLPTTAENGVAIAGTQTAGGVKVDDANKSQLIYEETKKTVTGITLGEVTFAKDGTARAFDNTYDATAATINGDNLKFTEASAASMETGDTMTILDANAAFKSGGAALVAFADKSYTVAFSETNTDQNVTIAGTHSDTLSQDAAKTKLTYMVGTKDVNTVALGKVDFVKGSTLFDRSGAGYNYAGVAALGTDGFAVSYASPETVATGDSMTLLQANATLKDMAEQVKQTSYSYTPVEGVTVDAAVTGSLEAKGGNVTYTATANQASKLTFTSVDWKDSGALMTRPSNITFAGADVDTTKIHFQNVKELDANKKMTLVSDFGDSVGAITGTRYTVGAGLEGEGAASLSGSDLVFTTKTGARDLAAQEQTHNTLMVMEAGMAVLAAGNEYVGQTMAELANPQNVSLDGTVTAASLGGSKSRYKTGSHVDSNNWNVAVAVGSKRELKKGSLEWGVFGEYGKSNYTLHSDAGRGDGDSHYAGGGLMAKWTNKHDVYTEASVRLGRLSDTASNLLRDAAGNGYGYDVHANYFGAHVGIGKIIRYKGGKSLDVYGKYFYTKRDGVDFASGGNNYSLDSVASSILRVGARYGTTDKKWNWYGGLAYEYEFDGKSEGTVDGVGIRAASVKGGSVRGEIGLRMSATKTNPWQTDISIYGYGGKHRGFGGSVNVAYMF